MCNGETSIPFGDPIFELRAECPRCLGQGFVDKR
jgi:hypothetical protein